MLLLSYDAKPNRMSLTPDLKAFHTEIFQPTPLHSACYTNNVPAIESELDGGVDVDLTNNRYGITCLHVAVTKGHIDAVRSLVKRGAGVFAIDTNCRTSLHLACAFGHPELVRVLLLASLALPMAGCD